MTKQSLLVSRSGYLQHLVDGVPFVICRLPENCGLRTTIALPLSTAAKTENPICSCYACQIIKSKPELMLEIRRESTESD